MKYIPENIPMRANLFGDGAKGMAWQQQRNHEYGVQVDAVRAKHGAPWVEAWTSDHLPDREYKTFQELRAAHNGALHQDELVPFQAVVLRVDPREARSSGGCWRCHHGVWTWSVRAKTGWRATDEAQVPSCEACLEQVKADPIAAIEARRKWVREHPVGRFGA